MNDSGYSSTTILLAFVAGATAGAVVALLLAPKPGRELREDILGLGRDIGPMAMRVPNAVKSAYDRATSVAVDTFNEKMGDSDIRV